MYCNYQRGSNEDCESQPHSQPLGRSESQLLSALRPSQGDLGVWLYAVLRLSRPMRIALSCVCVCVCVHVCARASERASLCVCACCVYVGVWGWSQPRSGTVCIGNSISFNIVMTKLSLCVCVWLSVLVVLTWRHGRAELGVNCKHPSKRLQ